MGSNKIKELRSITNLSQSQFAKRFSIPVSTLRKWEQMESKPPLYFVILLEKEIGSKSKSDRILKTANNEFFIDYVKKTISDKFGNTLPFEGDISSISDNFLLFGIEPFFEKYYQLIKNMNKFIYDASSEEKTDGNK